MTGSETAVAIVLALAVIGEWLAVIGLAAMRSVYGRLHYAGLATLVGPPLIAAAVAIHHSSAEAVIKAVLTALALLIIAPVLTHATARAAHTRQQVSSHEGGEP
ncbi:MAG TPA: monovalent cation/H(+) antiporter subunit G [Pirellulales bacterium]|jgi:monovalent cation/proton antiporter MnhG/PhaG subunit|nr:monovalent cation/H(+) antiporter subunit G [Pirellulales bacterium]